MWDRVGNKENCCWVDEHYHVPHPLPSKMTKEKSQFIWVKDHCLIAHPLSFKAVRDIRQEVWLYCTASLHISCVLKWSGIAIIRRKVISKGLILLMPLDPGKGQILWTEKMTLCAGHFEVVIHRYKNIIRWSKSDYLMPSINVF